MLLIEFNNKNSIFHIEIINKTVPDNYLQFFKQIFVLIQ